MSDDKKPLGRVGMYCRAKNGEVEFKEFDPNVEDVPGPKAGWYDSPVKVPLKPFKDAEEPKAYGKLTVEQLQAECAAREIVPDKDAKKADLVALLEESDKAKAAG